ncbi:protein MAINTENANCE OF MERISTEMS-like [Camellia sinensis]|uniref:protein MAINTENANCE OF MERISTEMS-like n=1 Tax=Camellia sinensis TaxID=4442 RepID=UPI001036A607|nr:protein MAINTENANCE OF MERISTEMS-like [Camellia sinensis]
MEIPSFVRHIVDEAGFGPFYAGLSRHPVSRTLMGALVERWWDTTNSFHFSATEDMMMSPYDFSMLTALDVAGRPIPYDADMGEWEAAWIYLLGARPPIDRSSGRVRYTWFSERLRGTLPETIEAIQQYAQGFLMFLLGTTLFSDRENILGLYLLSALLWIYSYLLTLALELKVEVPLEILFSRIFEGRCRPRPRETLLYLWQFFDTVRATEITWQPWAPLSGDARFRFPEAWAVSRYRVLFEGPAGSAWFLGDRFLR